MSNETKFLGNCEIDHTAIPSSQSLSATPPLPLVKAELSFGKVDLHNPATATAAVVNVRV